MKKSPSEESKHPSVRIEMSRNTFEALQDALINKMRPLGLDTDGPRSAKFYGMGDYAPNIPGGERFKTVASIIAADTGVQNLLAELEEEGENVKTANFGDYLYKKANELRRDKGKMAVEFVGKKYVYGFFRFLGCETLEQFEENLYAAAGAQTERGAAAPQDTDEWTYYIGAYFSVKSFGVRRFVLAINFTRQVAPNRFPAKEWGFHKLGDTTEHEPASSQKTKIEYDGFANIVDKRWLCVQLEAKENKNPFFLLGAVPDNIVNIKKQRVIQSILLSISVRHYPVSAEALLIQTTKDYAHKAVTMQEKLAPPILEPSLNVDESDVLKLYIMLQRRNFYTNPKIVETALGLHAKGSPLNNFTYLQGVWRILNFGLRRGFVVQSVMVVEPRQFRATLYPYLKDHIAGRNKNLTEQAIVFNISRIRQNKLCLISYGEPGMSVASYAIFDLETDNGEGFFEGCFISTGYDQHGIIGGYCIVQKVKDDDNIYLQVRDLQKNGSDKEAAELARTHNAEHLLDLKPMAMSEKEMAAYSQKHKLENAYLGLRRIWRKKLWEQRKRFGDDYPYTPEIVKFGQTLYVFKAPLKCEVQYKNGQIGIAYPHPPLNISVWAASREAAESAFAAALHQLYTEHSVAGQANPLTFWLKVVIDLSEN